jgi:hypothetical protein
VVTDGGERRCAGTKDKPEREESRSMASELEVLHDFMACSCVKGDPVYRRVRQRVN